MLPINTDNIFTLSAGVIPNNTVHSTTVNPIQISPQSLQPIASLMISAQNRGLSHLEERIEQNIQEAQNRLFQVVFDVGLQIGMGIQALRSEQLLLQSEQRTLQRDITELNLLHQAELSAVYDGFMVKRRAIINMIRTVVERSEVFHKSYPNIGVLKTEELSLRNIIVALENTEAETRSHDYPNVTQNRMQIYQPTTLKTVSQALVLRQANPMIRNLTQRVMEEYEALEVEMVSIRETNHSLIERKTLMSDYHRRVIHDLHRSENEFRLRNIKTRISSIFVVMDGHVVEWERTRKEFFDNREQIDSMRRSFGVLNHSMAADIFIGAYKPHFSELLRKDQELIPKVKPEEPIKDLKEMRNLMVNIIVKLDEQSTVN